MYLKRTNEIYFPHLIPTNVLGEKVHKWSDVNGGAKNIETLGLKANSFFGGRVSVLGLIKEYGMYACQQRESNNVIGFYVHDPEQLTPLGKKLVKQYFDGIKVVFETYVEKAPTEAEKKKLAQVREKYREQGMPSELVDHSTVDELVALEKAIESGKAEKAMAVVQSATLDAMITEDAPHIHVGEELSSVAAAKIGRK